MLPLYYICIIYYFIVETFIFKDIPVDPYNLGWVRYFFILNGILPNDGLFWSNLGITWTIPVFLFFYLLVPAIQKYVINLKYSILFWCLCFFAGNIVSKTMGEFFHVIYELKYFAAGIIIFYALKENKEQITAAILILCSFVLSVLTEKYTLISMCLFAVLLLVFEGFEVNKRYKHLCETISILDRYSYTFYLAHGIVVCHFLIKFQFSKIAIVIIGFIGSVVLTWVINFYLEKKIQDTIQKRFFQH